MTETHSPLQLSDHQMTTLMQMAQPLPPDRRERFLIEVATRLRGQATLGDGLVSRTCAAVQAELMDYPLVQQHGRHGSLIIF
jgi:hypothetical protein